MYFARFLHILLSFFYVVLAIVAALILHWPEFRTEDLPISIDLPRYTFPSWFVLSLVAGLDVVGLARGRGRIGHVGHLGGTYLGDKLSIRVLSL